MSIRALSKTESAYVRDHLELLLREHQTQTILARKTGISQQTISKILSGDPVGLHVAKKIAHYIGVSMEQLLAAPQPAIDEALRVSGHARWSASAIAAVRALPDVDSIDVPQAIALLDKAEAGIRSLRTELRKMTR